MHSVSIASHLPLEILLSSGNACRRILRQRRPYAYKVYCSGEPTFTQSVKAAMHPAGLSNKTDRINEAACVAEDSGDSLSSLINTEGKMSNPYAQRVHGIKQSDLDKAPLFECASQLILSPWLRSEPVSCWANWGTSP